MQWYEGSVASAVAEVKNQHAILVVFICGDDEQSTKMAHALEDDEIGRRLNAVKYIALKLQPNSESSQQFAQIYPVVVIPSAFFIGENGVPLEVIGGFANVEELVLKVDKALKLHLVQASSSSIPEPASQAEGVSLQQNSSISPASTSSISGLSSVNASNNPATIDERVEKAKKLIAAQQAKKIETERNAEKLKEIERRNLGRGLHDLKRQQQEMEQRQIADDIAREKAEARAARERVREQIARDRADRAAKYQADQQEQERRSQEAAVAREERLIAEAAARSQFSRLQFRLPDGTSVTQQFDAGAPLQEVVTFVAEEVHPQFGSFTLSTSFPRRSFQQSDYAMSLRDLGLAPSAAVMVLPVQKSSSLLPTSGSSFNIFWSISSLFLSILRFFQNFLFGTLPNTTSGNNQSSSPHVQPSNTQSASPPASSQTNRNYLDKPPNEGFGRQEGNIRRLVNDDDDDDDENNTWNGNSTQQM